MPRANRRGGALFCERHLESAESSILRAIGPSQSIVGESGKTPCQRSWSAPTQRLTTWQYHLKHFNNRIVGGHGALNQLVKSKRGFRSLDTANTKPGVRNEIKSQPAHSTMQPVFCLPRGLLVQCQRIQENRTGRAFPPLDDIGHRSVCFFSASSWAHLIAANFAKALNLAIRPQMLRSDQVAMAIFKRAFGGDRGAKRIHIAAAQVIMVKKKKRLLKWR